MDSGNSGSLQSSSGGDEEYDSRAADSFSAFISHQPPPPLQQPPGPPPHPFDPLSNYLQLQNSNSPLFNPNIFWPRNMNLRSEPYNNPTDSHNIINSPFMASFHHPTEVSDSVAPLDSAADNRTQNQNKAARNSKKRSRASRRAPTTVLTTDTTNFRAMVQEFTGIPAPPFTSSSPFQRNRFDLYGTPLSMRSKPHDTSQPPLLHRPFPQKVQSPPPPPPPQILASTTSTASSTSNAASTSTPPITHHLSTQSSNLFNISNPIPTSFLQNNHKFPFYGSNLGSKIQGTFEIPSNHHSNIKMGGFDEFSLGHGSITATLNSLPNLIPSDQIQPRNDHNDNNSTSNINDDLTNWRNNAVSPDEVDHDQAQMRLNHGNYNFSRNSINGKMNYLDSTSNFHGEKGQENVATRSEGMVESWICSSEYK